MRRIVIAVLAVALFGCAAQGPQGNGPAAVAVLKRNIPADVSTIRGFNYESSPTIGHNEMWLQYNPAETDRDMGYANRLNLNQVRVFLGYTAYLRDKAAFRRNLIDFVRTCHKHDIGVMPTLTYPREWSQDQSYWPQAREYAADLVNTIGNGKEPGVAFWDVHNEPGTARIAFARHMAGVFRELDKVTPITIGCTTEAEMEATGSDLVDVLCFHDYSSTRGEILAKIQRAKRYAASQGKQVMNTEIGCIARSNPYDVTLQEYMQSGVGWYIWELMITGQWGTVHGVLYADGTVRDPSIAAALMGFFRNRGPDRFTSDGWSADCLVGLCSSIRPFPRLLRRSCRCEVSRAAGRRESANPGHVGR